MIQNDKIYDVAIIGAGPGGATLAYLLIQSGLKVCLIDKDVFPRKKVCAGGLPVKILDVLPVDIASVIENEVSNVALTYKIGNEFFREFNKPLIYTVDRRKFDNLFLHHAKRAGAVVFEGNKVEAVSLIDNTCATTTTTTQNVFSKVVVGADGANSVVARNVGLDPIDNRHVALQIEIPMERFVKIRSNAPSSILLDWGSVEDGYGWVFPNGDFVSLGIMVPSKIGNYASKYQKDWMKLFGLNMEEFTLEGHSIPHRLKMNPIVKKQAILIGDAAGLCDFWTGEGIYYAIKSAQIAARQIEKYLKGDTNSLKEYQDIIDRDILPELKASRSFSKLFNYIAPIAVYYIKNYSYPWDLFCRIMRGDRTFFDVKKRLRPDLLMKKILFANKRNS